MSKSVKYNNNDIFTNFSFVVILCLLWYLLVALLIPGLSIHSIAWHLPPIGHVLANLLRVTVPLAPLVVGLWCEAHRVLLTYGIVFLGDRISSDRSCRITQL